MVRSTIQRRLYRRRGRPSWVTDRLARSDQFDTIQCKLGIKVVAVVGFVTNDALGSLAREHKAEEFLDEAAFPHAWQKPCSRPPAIPWRRPRS